MASRQLSSPYIGAGALTREQFLFYEMRTTARLMMEGASDTDITARIIDENLFQYPTEKSVKRISECCIKRLRALNDQDLIDAIATAPSDTAMQICLYAMMKQYRLVWDFMITVIGEKYRTQDLHFSRADINAFLVRLQEQDDYVAKWGESTVKKIISVLIRMLIMAGYLDDNRTDHINPVLLSTQLEIGIRNNNDTMAFSAFNYFT